MSERPTEDQCREGLALLEAVKSTELWARLFIGPEITETARFKPPLTEGEGWKAFYVPDPKGSKVVLPRSLWGTDYVRFYDGRGVERTNALRFLIGDRGWCVRVQRSVEADLPGLVVHLPEAPEAKAWIYWYDWSLE